MKVVIYSTGGMCTGSKTPANKLCEWCDYSDYFKFGQYVSSLDTFLIVDKYEVGDKQTRHNLNMIES